MTLSSKQVIVISAFFAEGLSNWNYLQRQKNTNYEYSIFLTLIKYKEKVNPSNYEKEKSLIQMNKGTTKRFTCIYLQLTEEKNTFSICMTYLWRR